MRRFLSSSTITVGLAVFSMLFGAGNLMFPIKVGIISGTYNFWGILGFCITAVLLPLAGLYSIIFFDGDYRAFFHRIGKGPGEILLFLCMFIIGPGIAMPRITTLSYIMISPFMPTMSLFLFSCIFLIITFFAVARENFIVQLLGNIISPILLISLAIIVAKGLLTTGTTPLEPSADALTLLWKNLKYGFSTMDLLGAIFFSAIVLTILKRTHEITGPEKHKRLAALGLKAGALGIILLALVYIGLSYLGVYFGHGLENVDEGSVFSSLSFRVLGSHGAFIISTAVLGACFSTIIALAAVVAEYVQATLFKDRISFIVSLVLILGLTAVTSNFGLATILKYTVPVLDIVYPVIITITLCNIAYKMYGFKPIKTPVIITALATIILNVWHYMS